MIRTTDLAEHALTIMREAMEKTATATHALNAATKYLATVLTVCTSSALEIMQTAKTAHELAQATYADAKSELDVAAATFRAAVAEYDEAVEVSEQATIRSKRAYIALLRKENEERLVDISHISSCYFVEN